MRYIVVRQTGSALPCRFHSRQIHSIFATHCLIMSPTTKVRQLLGNGPEPKSSAGRTRDHPPHLTSALPVRSPGRGGSTTRTKKLIFLGSNCHFQLVIVRCDATPQGGCKNLPLPICVKKSHAASLDRSSRTPTFPKGSASVATSGKGCTQMRDIHASITMPIPESPAAPHHKRHSNTRTTLYRTPPSVVELWYEKDCTHGCGTHNTSNRI